MHLMPQMSYIKDRVPTPDNNWKVTLSLLWGPWRSGLGDHPPRTEPCHPACPQIRGSVGHRVHGPSASSTLLRVCGSAGCRRSSTANATHVHTKLPKTSEASARGPVTAMTWPTSQGSTMPPTLSPSKMSPLTVAVSVRDCPARVKPIGQRGAMQKHNA